MQRESGSEKVSKINLNHINLYLGEYFIPPTSTLNRKYFIDLLTG